LGIPTPVSVIIMFRFSISLIALTSMLPPSGVNLNAFESKLLIIFSNLSLEG